jgi:hypothetical protein
MLELLRALPVLRRESELCGFSHRAQGKANHIALGRQAIPSAAEFAKLRGAEALSGYFIKFIMIKIVTFLGKMCSHSW